MSVKQRVFVTEGNNTTPIIDGMFFFSTNANKRARMIRHPVESGGYVFDNKIVEPIRVTLTGSASALVGDEGVAKLMDKLDEMLTNRTFNFYTVTTLTKSYSNMSLVGCPSRENAEHPDMAEFTLEFEEVLLGTSTPAVPRDGADASTVS